MAISLAAIQNDIVEDNNMWSAHIYFDSGVSGFNSFATADPRRQLHFELAFEEIIRQRWQGARFQFAMKLFVAPDRLKFRSRCKRAFFIECSCGKSLQEISQ